MASAKTTEEGGTDGSSEVSNILIHKGESVRQAKSVDPDTVDASIIRSRGEMQDVSVKTNDEGEVDSYVVRISKGPSRSKTGFFMRFIPDQLRSIDPMSLVNMDILHDYPVPKTAVESLSPAMVQELDNKGYLAVSGVYSSENGRIYAISRGWSDFEDADFEEKLSKIVEITGAPTLAFDYMYVKELGWELESVAEMRGVKKRSVKVNVDEVQTALDQL